MRRAAVLFAVASFAVLVFALTSGPAMAGGTPGQLTLTVNVTGTGDGSVTDVSGGVTINCQKNGGLITGCGPFGVPFANPADAVVVGLIATPAANSHFTGWTVQGGDSTFGCGQQVTCYITMTGDATVTANFTATPTGFGLTVQRTGNAANTGSVFSTPPGISCSPSVQSPVCTATYDQNTPVTLTATPASGTTFAGWGNACASFGTNPTCVVVMSQARFVTAEFDDVTFALTVTLQGNGGVTSNIQPGIDCFSGTNTGCSFSFHEGAQVVLTAAPGPGYTFTGWTGGGCTGTGTCTVTVNGVSGVTANFVVAEVQASVTSSRVTCTGPRVARRQLKITVNAEQAVTVVVRLRNPRGVTVQRKTVVEEEPDVFQITMNIGNGKRPGRYTAQVTMTNDFGASKVQTRNVRLRTANCR